MLKKTTVAVSIALSATMGAAGCDNARNDLDETANTDPPYEGLDVREKAQQEKTAQQQQAPRSNTNDEASGTAGAHTDVRSVADITGNPSDFAGEKVVVQGDVEEVHRGHGFRLDDESPARGGIDDDLLVLGAKDSSWNVDDGWDSTQVRVEGRVRRVRGAELEKDLGWTFDTKLKDAIEGKELVLVADNVQRVND